MIGLRPQHFPSPEEDLFIFNYLRVNFGHKTLDELYLAFDLAIKGKLDIESKPYDQFSILYLVSIMNAFRIYSNHLMKEMPQKPMETLPPPTETEQEMINDVMEYVKNDFYNFRNLLMIPLYLFTICEKLSFINQTEKQKIKMYGKAVQYRKNMLKNETIVNISHNREYQKFIKDLENNTLSSFEIQFISDIYKRMSILEYLIEKRKCLKEENL